MYEFSTAIAIRFEKRAIYVSNQLKITMKPKSFDRESCEAKLYEKAQKLINNHIPGGCGVLLKIAVLLPEEIGNKWGQRLRWERDSPPMTKRERKGAIAEYLRSKKMRASRR